MLAIAARGYFPPQSSSEGKDPATTNASSTSAADQAAAGAAAVAEAQADKEAADKEAADQAAADKAVADKAVADKAVAARRIADANRLTTAQENAKRKAESYLEMSGFSRSGLIEQLKYEGFTSMQAAHGAGSVGL